MTNRLDTFGALHRYALTQGLDDWVGLWLMLDYAHDELGLEGESLRLEVIETIGDLARAQLMEVGDVTEADGFRAWPVPSNQVIAEVRQRWASGQNIQMGDVCWLNITSAGAELAEKLLLDEADRR